MARDPAAGDAMPYAPTGDAPARTRFWGLAILFTVGALNLFDRQVINVLAQDIKIELHLSDAKLGLLTGTAFGLCYALFGLPLGWLADRVDRVRLISSMLAVWSGFTILCGLAGSYAVLFIGRIGVGVGESGSQPASTALIPDLFPERQRSSAMSLLLFGAPFGSFLGLLIGGAVASAWGWRAAFIVAGLPGLFVALLMLTTMRDPRSRSGRSSARFEGSLFAALKDLLRKPRYLSLAGALTASTFLVYGSSAWLPPFFIRVHGMSTGQVGGYSAIAVGLGGGLGTLGSGILCDLLRARISHVESKVLLVLLGAAIPSLLVTVLAADVRIALVAMFVFNICGFAWLAPTTRLIQTAVGPAHHALAIAFGGTLATILSLSIGLPLIGWASDRLTPVSGAHAIGYALALTIPLVALLGFALHMHVLRALKRDATASSGWTRYDNW